MNHYERHDEQRHRKRILRSKIAILPSYFTGRVMKASTEHTYCHNEIRNQAHLSS